MKFDEWFNEQLSYSLRSEWFFNEAEVAGKPGNAEPLVKWLKAAYEEGYNQSRYDTMKLYWDDGK